MNEILSKITEYPIATGVVVVLLIIGYFALGKKYRAILFPVAFLRKYLIRLAILVIIGLAVYQVGILMDWWPQMKTK